MKKINWVFIFVLVSCVSMPDGVKPVDNFQAKRYLGQWYEIARLDHSFERRLTRVTAEYSRREDGGIEFTHFDWFYFGCRDYELPITLR